MTYMPITSKKKRFRDYGFAVGELSTGARNAITDVAGVRVGHLTKIEGDDVRTGITIIDPGVPDLFRKKIPGAVAIGNGTGTVAGFSEVEELGTIEAPIALTSTLAVGIITTGMIACVRQGLGEATWMDTPNIVVGEINDGRLNNVHKNSLRPDDVLRACENMSEDVQIGNVGGGTGGRAFSWKGGIGTASRQASVGGKTYTIGVLSQTNFGGALTILGVPVWKSLGKNDFNIKPQPRKDGSCMTVVATDAPLTARQLKRMANRVFLGLGRTGAVMNPQSGDFAIAFTTNRTGLEGSGEVGQCLSDNDLMLFFLAAVDATEESVYDAMFAAETMSGWQGRTLEALPIEKILPLLETHQKIV